MQIVWRYLDSGNSRVIHAFSRSGSVSPVCGVGYVGFPGIWRSDPKGLSKRRPCKRCVEMLE